MDISKAYNQALELEGLLLLLKAGDVDRLKVELIFARLFEKIDELDGEIDTLNRQFIAEAEAEVEVRQSAISADVPDAADPVVESEAVVEEAPMQPAVVDEAAAEPLEEKDNDDDYFDESEAFSKEPEAAVDDEIEEEQVEVRRIEETEIEQPQPEETTASEAKITEQEAIADNALFEEEADADVTPATPPAVEEHAPASTAQPEYVAATAYTQPKTKSHINITIDESGVDVNQSAFAQKARGDIRKVFTLNDIFRFRRQLFGNSQERYTKALTDISKMKSTYEAENYIYNTLNLDKDNVDVKDFMNIISAYFMGK